MALRSALALTLLTGVTGGLLQLTPRPAQAQAQNQTATTTTPTTEAAPPDRPSPPDRLSPPDRPSPAVACRRSGLAEHPLRDNQGAALFYYGLPLELLDAEQRAFLGSLFKGAAGCTLSAGAARLGGQPGMLVTLVYADGVSLQAFCRGNSFKTCLVRSRQANDPSPAWSAGVLQVVKPANGGTAAPANLETVEIEVVSSDPRQPGKGKLQPLGSFRAPAQLLQAQPDGL